MIMMMIIIIRTCSIKWDSVVKSSTSIEALSGEQQLSQLQQLSCSTCSPKYVDNSQEIYIKLYY